MLQSIRGKEDGIEDGGADDAGDVVRERGRHARHSTPEQNKCLLDLVAGLEKERRDKIDRVCKRSKETSTCVRVLQWNWREVIEWGDIGHGSNSEGRRPGAHIADGRR